MGKLLTTLIAGRKRTASIRWKNMRIRISSILTAASIGFILYLSLYLTYPGGPSPFLVKLRHMPRVRQAAPVAPPGKEEVRHVIFLKVHKAASSTVQNILLRFALARNLSVLLPSQSSVINEFGSKIKPGQVIPPYNGSLYNILCNHIIYDNSVITPFFPKNSIRIGIVREPLQQALSALKYYTTKYPNPALLNGVRKHNGRPLEGFLANPRDFYNLTKGPRRSYINNRMSVDFGFNINNFEESKKNATTVINFLDQLDRQFHLVLIADYFDESVVLLRRLLNWSMKDIVYLKINTAEQDDNSGLQSSMWERKPSLNTSTQAFRHWAAIDYQLYYHFLAAFFNRIKQEPLFMEEVEAFKQIQEMIVPFCTQTKGNSLTIPASPWTEKFVLTKSDCQLMTMTEETIVELARKRQQPPAKTYSTFSPSTKPF